MSQCATLSKLFPDDVAVPGTEDYAQSNNYWSTRQAELSPGCFVSPRSTEDVSIIIKALTCAKASFTVKGGGHSAFEGASNTDGGVTIDLAHLNQITVSEDKSTVSIGPGNRWINVSEALDPQGLAVVGGRVASVGVSGLTLGGGISYFSGKYGWACDNVRNYEVVLSSGKVVNASPDEHEDLYWALRGGGGSNLGLVTRFDLAAFKQGDLWSNTVIFPGPMNQTLIPTFADLAKNKLPEDLEAHTYFIMAYQPDFGGVVTAASFYHATFSDENAVPEVFESFEGLPGSLVDIKSVANVSTQSRAIDEAYGLRQTWWDTTVKITSPELFQKIALLFDGHLATLLEAAGTTTLLPFLVYQPIPTNVLEAMQKNGGNALGLHPDDGPLMIIQLTTKWSDSSIDDVIETASEKFIADVEKLAKEYDASKGYVYMNYAGKSQDVLRSYGEDNFARLQKIAKKYDPKGHLQRDWTGYFQLGGVE
jgi:FAD/FMN-containing dehydrogenase